MLQHAALRTNALRLIGSTLLACSASLAQASLTVTSVVGGVANGVKYVNFDNLALGSTGGTSNGVRVTLTGSAQVVQGSVPRQYAAPYISNSNAVLFGDNTVSGPDSTRYLSTGHTGSITFTMPEPELYLGLLWGSVDPENTLTFYDARGNNIGSITGTDITSSANGDRGAQGTYYVNITSTQSFSRVVATANGQVFEIDNLAYNATVPVPEASTYAMLLAGLGVLGVVSRRRKAA